MNDLKHRSTHQPNTIAQAAAATGQAIGLLPAVVACLCFDP